MATWNQPHQQAAPETAGLASCLAALDSAESSAVERVHLRRKNNVKKMYFLKDILTVLLFDLICQNSVVYLLQCL